MLDFKRVPHSPPDHSIIDIVTNLYTYNTRAGFISKGLGDSWRFTLYLLSIYFLYHLSMLNFTEDSKHSPVRSIMMHVDNHLHTQIKGGTNAPSIR
jgi:hypothetical protein